MQINETSNNNDLHLNSSKELAEKCMRIVENGTGSADEADYYSWTPIMYAARNGDLQAVKVLYENGATINTSNKYGFTPLSLAVVCECEDTFNFIFDTILISSKEDFKKEGVSFGLACFFGKTNLIKKYLSLNIFDINEPLLYGLPPLLLAASNGKVETAKVLIAAGANKFASNFQLQTSYDIAEYRRDTKMQALLSDNKFCSSPIAPLTPLNNRMAISPSLTFSVPNKTRKTIFNNASDSSENQSFYSSSSSSSSSFNINLLSDEKVDDTQKHSLCNCHYLNSLLSPRTFDSDKSTLYSKEGVTTTEKNRKSKYLTVKKDKVFLPWIKKKIYKRNCKSNENLSNELDDMNKENQSRIKDNLKITYLLTALHLEEYISTFILQEIDADILPSITEEDLINMGINKDKCGEILEKISVLK